MGQIRFDERPVWTGRAEERAALQTHAGEAQLDLCIVEGLPEQTVRTAYEHRAGRFGLQAAASPPTKIRAGASSEIAKGFEASAREGKAAEKAKPENRK